MNVGPTRGEGTEAMAADIDAQVQAARVASLYQLSTVPVLVGLLFSAFPVLLLWPHLPHGLLSAWLGARCLISLLRCLDALRFKRCAPGPLEIRPWRRRFLLLLGLDGLSWGAMGWFFHTPAVPDLNGIVLACIVGLGAIGLFSLGAVFCALLLFSITCFAPLMLFQGLIGNAAGALSVLGLGMFLAVAFYESRRIEAHHCELLRLRFETAAVAEQRQAALQSAELSSTSKSRFVAVMSHEIRTPLNGILGMTQLLERSALDDKQREQLDIVRRSGRHLLTLVNDILDLARIESGKLVVESGPVLVREVVDDVCQLLEPTAKDKGLGFALELGTGLPSHALGDASRIKQVLHNLVGNAIKFTERGQVVVQVSTILDMRAGTLLRFAVRDTGEGIAADQMERIFAPFEQAAGAGARRRDGTGLGLTISRELARAMGGDLRCASSPGQGSVFEFTLPLLSCPATGSHSSPHPSPGADLLPNLQGRVLLVDDSAVNLLVAASMMERCGLLVDTAEHGAEALEKLQRQPYALVLMDCQMPQMNGFDATFAWRQHEAREGLSRTPVIALTASAVNGDRERCLACGMDDYLVKPFEMQDLLAVVQRHLPRTEPLRQSANSDALLEALPA